MHATQIATTVTISAAMPLKASAAPQSSTLPEGFGLRWHQDILAADASVSGQCPTAANALSRRTEPGEQSAIFKVDANGVKNASAEMGAPVTQPIRDRSVVSTAPPNPAASLDGRVAERLAVKAAIAGTAVPVGVAVSLRSRRELKATHPGDSAEIGKPEDVPSLMGVVLTTPDVQRNVSTALHGEDIPQNLTANTSQASTAPSAPKLSQPSTSGLSDKETSAKPGPAAGEVIASGPSIHAPATPVGPSTSPAAAVAESGPNSTSSRGISPNSEVQFAGVSHLNQAETLGAIPQTSPPNHAALPSARTDLQLHAMNIADATGIRVLHVLPSGPAQLDVGVLDGTHGWLRIRAEMGAGGAVNASLTASGFAHESLKAALPEMAKYLGSEAVSVKTLAVHRFSAGSNTPDAAMATSQQNGDPRGNHSSGDGTKGERATQKNHSAASDELPPRPGTTAPTRIADFNSVSVPGSIEWIRGGTSRQTWSFGAMEGTNGSWLNVCA